MSAAATLIMIFNRSAVLVAYYLNEILSYRGLFLHYYQYWGFFGFQGKKLFFFWMCEPALFDTR